MGYYSIISNKDTMISEFYGDFNAGKNQLMNLYSSSAQYKNASVKKQDKTRLLVQFSLSSLETKISNGIIPSPIVNATTSAFLKLTNAKHRFPEPSSFDVQIYPLEVDWDEGDEVDDTFKSRGFCNWNFAKRNTAWETGVSGGSFDRSTSAIFHFAHEGENLYVDITSIVNLWLAGTSANNGLLLKLTDLDESLTALNIKKFFARHTSTPFPPQLEIVYDDWIHDDRPSVQYGVSSHLYLYNVANGQYTDIITNSLSGTFPGKISISANNKSTSISSNLEATRISKGKYRTYFELPWADESSTSYEDFWSITSPFNFTVTSSFTALNPYKKATVTNLQAKNLLISFFNLDDMIKKGTTVRVDVSISEDTCDQYINVPHTFPDDIIYIKDAEFRIKTTNDIVISPWQKLSYDKQGNFFIIDTDSLIPFVYYKIEIKFQYRDETIYKTTKEFQVKD